MTKNEIKNKIAKLIGLASYSFGSYKTKEGVELKTEADMLEVGALIYVVTPEGELPTPEGDYELDNGMVVSVKEGMVSEIKPAAEVSVETPEAEVEIEMTEATLADGTKITNDMEADFEVGQALYVITAEGEKVNAPEGEHTTESGIVITVDAAGMITGVKKPDTAGEGSLEPSSEMESVMEEFLSALKVMASEINKMKTAQNEFEQKFSKFSASPAGEKIYNRKNMSLDLGLSNKAEQLLKLRNK